MEQKDKSCLSDDHRRCLDQTNRRFRATARSHPAIGAELDRSRRWGGLPGLPVAIIAAERSLGLRLALVESDRRKAAFLQVAAQKLGLVVAIEACRIEARPPQPFDVVSARALAPLDRLCPLAHRFAGPNTVLLFPKGVQADSELTAAARHWHIRAERIASRTDPQATILRITELEPRS